MLQQQCLPVAPFLQSSISELRPYSEMKYSTPRSRQRRSSRPSAEPCVAHRAPFVRIQRLLEAASLLALVAVFACSSPAGESCYPGDYQFCDCPGGGHAMAQCARNGGDYGACVCKIAVGNGDADTDAPNASSTMDDAGDAGDAAASGEGGASAPLAVRKQRPVLDRLVLRLQREGAALLQGVQHRL